MAKTSLSATPKGANGKAPTGWNKFKAKFPAFIRKAFWFIVKAFAGAIVLTYMAERAPGLREKLPYFYEYVDLFVEILEYICSFIFQ